jgi:hypothetical protein
MDRRGRRSSACYRKPVLTSFTDYTAGSPSGTNLGSFGKATLQVTGSTAQAVMVDKAGVEKRSTLMLVVAGNTLSTPFTCQSPKPDAGQSTPAAPFTATSTSLLIIATAGTVSFSTAYTKL